jgi:hydrogenase maturation protein HypF
MAGFAMCAECAAEYQDPADRRYHAQPVCCPACGPRLALLDAEGRPLPGDPIDGAAALLRDDRIVAVKGLGGYHLAAGAGCEAAVAELRARKHREDKPFAVLAADLDAARRLCEVSEAAAGLLTSRARPIVLLPRLPSAAIAKSAAPGNRHLGIMLPYTPLHHLLVRAIAGPMVLTSGNESDEPIAYRDADAVGRLAGIADAFLTHDRAIHIRTDDSVTRAFRGRPMPVRRSRGYVPEPVVVPGGFPRPVLACGAELKTTFCLAKERHAFVSHHIGDLENAETLLSFTEGIEHFRRLFDIDPRVVAYDLHPEYLSTKYALDLADVDLACVQHHHAHIASCLADNGWPADGGRVIGVAFDGTGYGADGTIWGGEFLVADYAGFERGGHLAPIPMPGGQAAIRQPWRMAAAYLDAAGLDPGRADVARRNPARWPAVVSMARKGVSAPLTSSAGRLFDAVAAILGVRDTINYEGQAAIELEQLADPGERGRYRAGIDAVEPFRVRGADLIGAVAADLAAGVPREAVAARFHSGVAGVVEAGCLLLRERHGLATVALSGGVFQNMLLLSQVVTQLEERGFEVLTHSRVPCNDGGISLGQAAVAAARDRLGPGPGLRRHRVVAEPGVAGPERPDVRDPVIGHLRDPLRIADLAAANRDQVEVSALKAAHQLADPASASRVALLAVQRGHHVDVEAHAAHGDDRRVGERLHPARQAKVRAFPLGHPEAPRRRVEDVGSRRAQHGDQLPELGWFLNDLRVIVGLLPLGDADRDDEVRPGRLAHRLRHLGEERRAFGDRRPAVAIGAQVGSRPQELVEQETVG